MGTDRALEVLAVQRVVATGASLEKIAAAALEKGIPISKKFNARSPFNFSGRMFETCKGRQPVYGRYVVRSRWNDGIRIGRGGPLLSLETLNGDVRAAYEAWCAENGAEPLGARRFAAGLRARGVVDGVGVHGVRPGRTWQG